MATTNPASLPALSRRQLFLSAAAPLAATVCARGQQTSQRPNILFIAVDDLRPELSCYGVPIIQSPNIDRIAKRGMLFRRAYCQQAVCSPSRTSLLTGARPDSTKVWDLVTHFRDAMPGVVTLPQLFKQNGYFVQGIGKIFHPGYDDAPSWSVPWRTAKAPEYANHTPRDPAYTKDGPAFESGAVADDFYRDGKVANLAIEALRASAATPAVGSRQPFFLAVGFAKPHLPFVAPKKYWDLYDPARIPLAPNPRRPDNAPDYALTNSGELRNYPGIPKEGPIPDALARQLKHGYYAAVSYTDAQIGKLLDELDRLNLARNTIIVLWGDHGWKLGEHGEWCKHSNVENDTNAPLLLSVPGMRHAGARSSELVEFVDVYPTLAELAGLPLPGHLEGVSFKPLLDDPKRKWKSAAFSQYPRGQRVMGYSMRTSRYRLTVWVRRKDPASIEFTELYDHQSDPQENTNIASARPELVASLMKQWRGGWKGVRAELAAGN